MGELGFNKFFGAALATFLLIFGLNEVSTYLFGGGGHHGEHHYESNNEWAAANFHGYRIDIPEASSGGAADVEEPPLDLGLLLASADPAAGETVLKRECGACHTWNSGGGNGTGPNLYGVIGRDIATGADFRYSGALSGVDGNWTYEQMNEWLAAPTSFARGTTMSYAGLRSPRNDKARVDVMAYLASVSPNAPAFPDPLPVEVVTEETVTNAVEGIGTETGEAIEGVEETAAAVTENAGEAADGVIDTVAEGIDAATDTVVDAAEEAGTELLEEAVDTAEGIVDGAVDEATDGDR